MTFGADDARGSSDRRSSDRRPGSGSDSGSGPLSGGLRREEAVLHQPPNPADLDRVAPSTPECARVRGLLRDYVDGDLVPSQAQQVDEHVHGCRVCAVELSRAEHEVLRLRRAYLLDRATPAAPAAGFVARVVQRLVESAAEVSAAGASSTGASSIGASAADASVAGAGSSGGMVAGDASSCPGDGEPGRARSARGSRELDFALGSPASLLVVGVLLLFVLGIGVRVFSSAEIAFDQAASMVVTWANNAFDGDSNRLEPGDSVGDRGKLRVGNDGIARVDLRDSSRRTQPAASLELKGGEVRLEDGEPLLVHGRLEVLAKREVEIPMLDGTRIALGAGEYVIAADMSVDMFDENAFALESDPLGLLQGEMNVSIEVVSGAPARIIRPGGAVTLVARGNVGVYASGGGPVEVLRPGPVANLDRLPQPAPNAQEPPPPQVAGMALEANGMPTAMASVFLRSVVQGTGGQPVDEIGFAATGSDGRFTIATSAPCERDFSIVLAMPSNLRNDLALVPPQAVPLLRQNGQAQLSRPLRFDFSSRLLSSVVDESGMPVAGVHIEVCVVDELFGVLWPLDQRAVTASDGTFQISRLPARLPAHQRLMALLVHDQFELACVPVPVRGEVAAAANAGPMRLRPLHEVKFVGLPPNSSQTVLQEVDGQLASAVAVRRTVTTDFFGRVPPTLVGSGRMWLWNVQTDDLVALEFDGQSADVPRYQPTGETISRSKLFRQLRPVEGTRLMIGSSYRFEFVLLDKGENAASAPVLHVTDVQGFPVAEAQLFAVRDTGPRDSLELRFVGFSSPLGVVSLAGVLPDEDVVVLGANKAVGWLATPLAVAGTATVRVQPNGSVMLGASLRPAPGATERIVAIEFERVDAGLLPGLRPHAVRFACDENQWQVSDVPPGDYRVHVGEQVFEITVPPLGWFVLQ